MLAENQAILTAVDSQLNSNLGSAISVSGSRLVVGAPHANTINGVASGAVYIFSKSGNSWIQDIKLIAADGAANDHFGTSVSIDDDTIIVGAPNATVTSKTKAGAAYVFTITGTTWNQQAKLVASDPNTNNLFGTSVSIDASTIAIGAPFAQGVDPTQGAVYVNIRNGSVWEQQSRISFGQFGDNEFGCSVAINGDLLVIGARDYDELVISSGAAFLFKRSGTTWNRVTTLLANDPGFQDRLGNSVAISPDGRQILVGSSSKNTVWGTKAGAAYLYENTVGNTWIQKQKFIPPNGRSNDYFGYSVALSDTDAYVGTPYFNFDSGAVFQYRKLNGQWNEAGKVVAKQSQFGDQFGSAVSFEGTEVVFGALGKNGSGAAYAGVKGPPLPLNRHKSVSPLASCDFELPAAGNPIGLQNAEKREEITDFESITAQGKLTFTRIYLQTEQTSLDFMGLGWTHNHNLILTKIVGSPNTITVRWLSGGKAYYVETSLNHYEGTSGVFSSIDWDPVEQEYTLTSADKTVSKFDVDGRITSLIWPNGDEWDYSYVGVQLSQVSDQYGRKIVFRYFTNGSFAGQIFRVGDQTFNDTDPVNPDGRYIQLGYVHNKIVDSGGIIVNGSQSLLASVKDVRGNIYAFDYYGQQATQQDVRQLNFLIKRESPPVDNTGDGTADAPILLEDVMYELDGIDLVVNGTMEADSDWSAIPGSPPLINERSMTFVESGQFSRRILTNTTGQGIEGNSWDIQVGKTYIVTAKIYSLVGSAKFYIAGTNIFERTTSNTGAWELLRAVIVASSSVNDCKLVFASNVPNSEFFVDSVSVLETTNAITRILQGQGNNELSSDYTFMPEGQNQTNVKIAGKVTQYLFDNGVVAGAADPQNNFGGKYLNDQYRPISLVDPNGHETAMTWSGDGIRLDSVRDALNHQTQFNYNLVGPSANTLSESVDPEGRKTTYSYADVLNPRLPTEIKVFDVDLVTVLQWQKFTYDPKGRTLSERKVNPQNETEILQETTRTYYSSGNGNGLLHVLTQEDINGTDNVVTTYSYDYAGRINKTQRSSSFGNCDISFTVYDQAGNVVASICNYDPGSNPDPTTAAEAIALFNPAVPNQNRVTAHEYDAAGRRFKSISNAGAAYAITTLTVYDGLSRVIRTINNYVADPGVPHPFTAPHSAFQHGTANNQNLVSDTAFNLRGMVRRQIDVLGNATLYGYNDAGRVIKTVQFASQPNYNNDYAGISPDPALSSYISSTALDQDFISSTLYDSAGNVVKSVDILGHVQFTVYDPLNRPVKSVRNASLPNYDILTDSALAIPSTAGGYIYSSDVDKDMVESTEYDVMGRVVRVTDALENVTLTGYDALGRQVRSIRNASIPTYPIASDPTLSNYPINPDADQDLVTDTVYDQNGRVLYTVDLTDERTWTAYDGLGRAVKSIANAVGTATDGGPNDPRSNTYIPSSAPDRDLISLTTYDSSGRTLWTQDPLNRKTWYVYDDLGRQKKVIRNCTYISGTPTPEDDNYVGQHASDTSKDVITRTVYDAQGRVFATIDSRGNETRYEYDILGRRVKVVTNYVTGIYNNNFPDQDIIETVAYDLAGRQTAMTDNAGNETRYEYDTAGRRFRTIVNYQDGTYNPAFPDRDLISTTTYNKGGQVVSTTDPRQTQTAFGYDSAGRRRTITQAAGTGLATTGYTCYDKGGRILRTIQNYIADPLQPSPDARDTNGNFLFSPTVHGISDDQNLITTMTLDKLGRQLTMADPLNNLTSMNYRKDGQVMSQTDQEGTSTAFRYDRARRRTLVVQSYVPNEEDPSLWAWNSGWKTSSGDAIAFGTNNDQNVIVQTTVDKAGRVLTQREPRGNLTSYAYDLLDRRTNLTNPLSQQWQTSYTDVVAGKSRVTLTDPLTYQTQRDFDRLGRPSALQYVTESPKLTPDVTMTYDAASNRVSMSEFIGGNFTGKVRETVFGYDAVRRLTSASFDNDGSGTIDETVNYAYDAGGLRTTLTLPGSLSISYTYDARGLLTALTDWDNQQTRLKYDEVGRRRLVERPNRLKTTLLIDPAGRLRRLRHAADTDVLADFEYVVDKRGSRTRAQEMIGRPDAGTTVLDKDNPSVDYIRGVWNNAGTFKQTESLSGALRIACAGDLLTLTLGTGPDHSLCDIYIDSSYYITVDGYTDTSGETVVTIPVNDTGVHIVEVQNRYEHNPASGGYVLSFKSLVLNRAYDLHTWKYTYDALGRVNTANQYPASATSATPLRAYSYGFDVAGNRLTESLTLNGGGPMVTSHTYNANNQISSAGFSYDANGNLTDDGSNTYAWDRANRLLGMGGSVYAYDGMGNRVRQTVGAAVTQYLLDLQPGLAVVLTDTTGAAVNRYIHGPMGIHAQETPTGDWLWMIQDGLGSVRGVADDTSALVESRQYAPYGSAFAVTGTNQTVYGFTGEQTDSNALLYLRARYYVPSIGSLTSRDPVNNVNGYNYANSNPIRYVDLNGALPCDTTSGQDQDCLNRIEGTLQSLANNAELLGIWAPSSGGSAASRLIWHYLNGGGTTQENFSSDWLDPIFFELTEGLIEESLRSTSFLATVCSSGCCNSNGEQNLGQLLGQREIRTERYLGGPSSNSPIPSWFPSLPGPAKEAIGEYAADGQLITVENPFYLAYGGITVTGLGNSTLSNFTSAGLIGTFDVNTSVEFYDYYDWLFGGCNAGGSATGTHPENMRVGHFIALEEAGRASPFNWYSYSNITMHYSVTCVGNVPSLRKIRSTQRSILRPSSPVMLPCNTPTNRNSSNFNDNWPISKTQELASRGYDPIFPTIQQMDENGVIY